MSIPTTPNMNLEQPVVGVNSGLDWENAVNSNSGILDQHNHTPGFGVQIPPEGLDINSSLDFQGNEAINLQALIFKNQTSLATLNALYCINGELWFNDTTNPIQITKAGSVNATSSGISDGSGNSAAFQSGSLVVQNSSTAPDNIQCGSVLLGNQGTANSKFLSLSPPASMGSNYSVTLPASQSAQSFLAMDTGGNITGYAPVAGGITGGNIASSTITGSNIASSTVANSNLAALNYFISGSCGSGYSIPSTATAIPNFSGSLTTSGRPISISIQPVTNSPFAYGFLYGEGPSSSLSNIYIDFTVTFGGTATRVAGFSFNMIPNQVVGFTPTMEFVYTAGTTAGSYTVSVTAYQNGSIAYMGNLNLFVREL